MQDADADEMLLRRIAGGDAPAFRQLTARHASRVLALARGMLGDGMEAEDIVQEVFVRLWQHAAQWQPGRAQLATWLHRVTVNLCLNHLQRVRNRTAALDAEALDATAAPDSVEEDVSAAERQRLVHAAVARLPEQQRAAVALFYNAGASTAEAAAALDLSVKATESLLVRARRNLRERLAALLEVES
ncbi:MAG: sigma-70 family RNA polymerase sigma factor [Nevskiales bacterium]|nr:sigma-70 family RNA polymerase sigma factor [Nevskiales bacterium]